MIFPKKCENCPFIKCRALEWLKAKKKTKDLTSRDIEKFYSNNIKNNFDSSTPKKVIGRLKSSYFIKRNRKEEQDKEPLVGQFLPKHYQFTDKSKKYLDEYNSFLKGPLCKKIWRKKKRKQKIKEKEVKPKLLEEHRILQK